MLKRGMVIKVTDDYAIIATDGSEFLKIKTKQGMQTGQKIYIQESDVIYDESPKAKTRSHTFRYLSALAASILFAVIVLNPFGKDLVKAYAVVSLDINPSFEFRVDKDLKVIEAKSVGEDGRKMLSDSLKGKELSNAVKDLLIEVDDSGVKIDKGSAILVSSVTLDGSKDENIRKNVFSGIRDAFDERDDYDDSKVVFVDAMEKDIENAKDKNLSLGRYRLYEMGEGMIGEDEISESAIGDIVKMPEIEEDLKGDGDFIIDGDDMDEIYEEMLEHPDMDMDDLVDEYYEDEMDDEADGEYEDFDSEDMIEDEMDEDMDDIDDMEDALEEDEEMNEQPLEMEEYEHGGMEGKSDEAEEVLDEEERDYIDEEETLETSEEADEYDMEDDQEVESYDDSEMDSDYSSDYDSDDDSYDEEDD